MRPADPEPRRREPSLTAASWSAQIERDLSVLPSGRRQQAVRYGRWVLHSLSFEQHPWAATFTSAEKGAPILGAGPCPHLSRTRSAADLIMVGRMVDRHLRYRAFYSGGDEPLSLVVHEVARDGRRTGLLAGASLQRLVHGRLPVAVPQVVRTETTQVRPPGRWAPWPGSTPPTPGKAVDLVVEEWLPGRPARVEDAEVVAQLLATIRTLWSVEPLVTAPIGATSLARTRQRFTALVETPGDLWPGDVDHVTVRRRVHSLLDRNPSVTIGLSHGDPGVGNALRTEGGGVALIDWEDADRRPLSHDIFKILASSTAPPEHWGEFHPGLPGTLHRQSCSAHEQLALAILQFLEGWQSRTRRAQRRHALPAHRRRMHRMIRAVDALLA